MQTIARIEAHIADVKKEILEEAARLTELQKELEGHQAALATLTQSA